MKNLCDPLNNCNAAAAGASAFRNRITLFTATLFLLLLFCHSSNAQNANTNDESSRTIDSLKKLLLTDKPDTNKVNHLNALCNEYRLVGNYNVGLSEGKEALMIALKLNFKQGIAASYNNIGAIYWNQGNYPEALSNYFASLKIQEAIGDKRGIAASYNNIGAIYENQGNYPEALKNYFASLKIEKAIGNQQGIADSYNNIGVIYYSQGNYPEALSNFFASLKIKEAIGDKQGIATSYNNIGVIYDSQGNYPEALKNHFASLKIGEAIGNQQGIADSYNNIGVIYENQGNYPEALKNYFASLKIQETIGNKRGIAASFINLGLMQTKLNNLAVADDYLNKALALSKEIGSKEYIGASYSGLATLDSAMGKAAADKSSWRLAATKYRSQHENYKMYIIYRDSLNNEENRKKTMRLQMNYDYEKREAAIKAEADKQAAIAAAENRRQKIILWFTVLGLLFTAVFAAFVYRSLRVTRKQKRTIEVQKKFVEDAHKNTMDSIEYAALIQESMFTTDEYMQQVLSPAKNLTGDENLTGLKNLLGLQHPGYFLLFKPRDIVSGDFYWCYKTKEGKVIWAVCDCTGHGVPGAFMSMLCISQLDETIVEKGITEPDKILNEIRKNIIEKIGNRKGKKGSSDGMDCSICVWEKPLPHLGAGGQGGGHAGTLSFAGAHNPLYVVRHPTPNPSPIWEGSVLSPLMGGVGGGQGGLIELPPDNLSVGYDFGKEDALFTKKELALQKGDILYTFSDGFQTQFGGPKGKKFMVKHFRNLITETSAKPLEEQKEILSGTIEKWIGGGEQTDDICVIGVRV